MFENERSSMINKQIKSRGISDERILKVLNEIERHLFVPESDIELAYQDTPIPIGYEQTISQPYIVALMTEALEINKDNKILEIGTGSGYQTAILAELSTRVVTIERINELGIKAKKLLNKLGYSNIDFVIGDGTKGHIEKSPYDRIIVTAGAPYISKDLIKQLNIMGKLIIPVGNMKTQNLLIYTKISDTKYKTEELGKCRFVKLIGKDGWNDDI